MTREDYQLESKADGLLLSVMALLPDKAPTGIVQFSHGMCEHKERYLPIMEYLTERGFCCVIHDHRGHGKSVRSEEDLGYFYRAGANGAVADLALVMTDAKQKHPGLSHYLFGHSMGSLIATVFLKHLDDQIDGLILCGYPVYRTGVVQANLLAQMIASIRGGHYRSSLLQALFFKKFARRFPGESAQAWICSDATCLDAYAKDPLCKFIFTANGFHALASLMIESHSPSHWSVANPKLPIWSISGQEDVCMGAEEQFSQTVTNLQAHGYKNTFYHIYPSMRHEPLNEKEKHIVWSDIEEKLLLWNRS